jgi:hypothetical protein
LAGTIRAPPVAAEISDPTSMDASSDFPSTTSGTLAVVAPIEPDFIPPINNSASSNLVLSTGRPRRATRVPRRYC